MDPLPGTPTAAMRVQISDETYLGEVIASLERAGYRTQRVGANEILVSLDPTSTRLEVLRLDLDLQLRACEVAHPETNARLSPDSTAG
jgi:hypothetical protein